MRTILLLIIAVLIGGLAALGWRLVRQIGLRDRLERGFRGDD